MAARILLVGQGAASVRQTLGASAGGLVLDDATTLEECLDLARRGPPDMAVLSGGDPGAAALVEALAEAEATASLTVLVVEGAGPLPDAARLLALGARIVPSSELGVRHAIDETLASGAWLAGRRVLVADDDPGITWYFADLLRAQACTVDDVLDGRAALDRALAATPDVVVADILMPGLDGVRLVRHMKQDPVLRDVPAVLLSWKDDWLTRAREAGTEAWGYLAKRAEPSVALTCLRSALASRVRFEMKMRREGTVRGVLDDTTPHRLLTMSSSARPECRVSVRDGESLHEVQLRGGRPVTATRVSLQGSVLRGAAALGSLLSLRSGRFVVAREHGAVDGSLEGPLAAQLAVEIARLRAEGPPEIPAPRPWRASAGSDATVPTLATPPAHEPTVPLPAVVEGHPLAPVPTAPMPIVTLRMTPSPRQEAPQATAPLPTLRLARQAARPQSWTPDPLPSLTETPVSRPSRPVRRERRRWRGLLQAAAVLAVAVAGLVTGVGVRVIGSLGDHPSGTQAASKP